MGSSKGVSMLVVPDCHAHADYDNERFSALGEFINNRRPDTVVQGGDFADMPSLSQYDKGTRGFEGRRYWRDVEATLDAQNKLWAAVRSYNINRRKNKRRMYLPETHLLLGNHEDRINRATNTHSELHGTISIDDLQYHNYWDNVHPFKELVNIHGWSMSHFFPAGLMGRPIGGEHVGAALVKKQFKSCIAFHNHIFDLAERTNADGEKLVGISAGCYVHPDYSEGWCANTVDMWWRGVIYLTGVRDGYYDTIEIITQRELMKGLK